MPNSGVSHVESHSVQRITLEPGDEVIITSPLHYTNFTTKTMNEATKKTPIHYTNITTKKMNWATKKTRRNRKNRRSTRRNHK